MISTTSQAIIIDNGSGVIKGGLGGDEAPRSIFPNLVGKPKNESIVVGGDNRECFIGDKVNEKKGVLSISCPIEHGIVTNWEDMIKVWHHAFFSELLVECAEQPIMITETPNSTEESKEKITEIMFEYFNAPAIFFMPTNVLALFATGKKSGMVLDTGHDVTTALPVFEGYAILENLETEKYGGKAVTDSLRAIYEDRDPLIKGNFDIIHAMKEKYAHVSTGSKYIPKKESDGVLYSLPDDQKIRLGEELRRIPEQIFNPVDQGFSQRSVQQIIMESINKCDDLLQDEFWQNILVTGGNSMIQGYCERLDSELKVVSDGKSQLDVKEERIYLPWIGASLLSSLSIFHELCITREGYNKNGVNVVKRKCLL